MQVLLAAGASTLVISRDGRVDHTIVHTLLQNTGWPLNSSLRKRPMEVRLIFSSIGINYHWTEIVVYTCMKSILIHITLRNEYWRREVNFKIS